MRSLAPAVLAGAIALALIGLLAYGLTARGSGGEVDGTKPLQTPLPRLSGGGTRSVADFRGQVVVVNVFASWCPPCRQETPLLEREHRRLQRENATVLGVTYNDTSPDAKAFVKKYAVTFPVLRDVDEAFSRHLKVTGIPETFVLDRRGTIVAFQRAPVDRAWLRAAVRKAQRA